MERQNTNNLILMDCTETADFLKVKTSTIYSWISYGQLPNNLYRKLGRKPMFIQSEVVAWFLAGAKLG
ncbi:MAG: helix-turn-helix domain-containing protein, partial [Candidatus Gastranaerophilales bacterium]|nr:helix-turn-helix domain-containing protein [Candidatus Gastranaerophilales bacterium]